MTSGGDISASGVVAVGGRTELVAGGKTSSITFDNVNNDFGGAVSLSEVDNVTLADKNALILGQQTIAGDLVITTRGAVSDSAAISVAGTTQITAQNGTTNYDIALDASGHDFVGAVSLTGQSSIVRDESAVNLGAVDLAQDLTLYAQGAVNGTAQITVDGATLISAGDNVVSLTNATNDFGSQVNIQLAKDITIVDASALNFSGSSTGTSSDINLTAGGFLTLAHGTSATGHMDLTANGVSFGQAVVGGNLTVGSTGAAIIQRQQSNGGVATDSMIRITGTTNLTAASITLDHVNAFGGAVALTSTGAIELTTDGAIAFAASTVGGDLTVSTLEGMTQTGSISVAGASILTTSYDADIILSNAANDFTGLLDITYGRDANIADTSALNLTAQVLRDLTLNSGGALVVGSLTVGDDLAITAGSISDTNANVVDVTANTVLSSSGVITLDNQHKFGGTVTVLSATDTTLRDSDALQFAGVSISGDLSLNVNGVLTQSVASSVLVGGTADIVTTTGSTVTLAEIGNDFGGVVSLSATKGVALTDANALSIEGTIGADGLDVVAGGLVSFGATTVTGAVTVDTAGDIAQTGAVSFSMAADLSADGDATFEQTGNEFAATITLDVGGAASFIDINALAVSGRVGGDLLLTSGSSTSIGTLSVTGGLTIAAAGDILQTPSSAKLNVGGDTSLTASNGTVDYRIALNNRITDLVSVNDFGGALRIHAASDIDIRAIDTLRVLVTSSADANFYADEKLYLLGADVAGTLSAVGNFDMEGDITAEFIDFYSDSYLNMNGYSIVATAAGSDGYANVIAEGNITLGQISSQNGNIFIESKTGWVRDGLLTTSNDTNTEWNIKTAGVVSIVANAGSMNAVLWSPLYTGNSETSDNVAGSIDIAASSVNRMEAPDGVNLTVGEGIEELIFSGSLYSEQDVIINLGDADFTMEAGTTLSAQGDMSIITTGDATLSKIAVSDGNTINLDVGGNLIALVNADGSANLNGSKVLLDVGGTIGTTTKKISVDVQASDLETNGAIKFITTPSDAYLDIITANDGNKRRVVEIGSQTENWVIGKTLDVTASYADLSILGNLMASEISIFAEAGKLTMTDLKAITSDGNITLSGSAGLAISSLVGDMTASGTDQVITLTSSLGNISEITSGENANVLTAGELVISGQSIAVRGSGDLDLDVGTMDITTTSTNAGVANIESLSSETTVTGSDVTGILTLTVDQGDLTLAGNLAAGGIMFNLADSSASSVARDIIINDGVSVSALGAATLLATGDVQLSNISIGNGDLLIVADGNVLDNSLAETSNISMGSGELTIEAATINLDLDVGNIKSLTSTETDVASTPINISSFNANTNLDAIFTTGKAIFQQSQGNLNLTGTIFVDDLDMDVLAGSLSQTEGATLTVTNGINMTSSGDMALSSIASQDGSIALIVGGALVDASSTRESAIITTNNTDATVSLQASSIGTDSEIGEIEVKSNHIASVLATTGGAYIEVMLTSDLGVATAMGDVVITQSRGDLTITDQVLSTDGAVTITADGNLQMASASSLTARDGVNLTAEDGDLGLTSVTVTGSGTKTAISSFEATGDILDVNPWVDGPSLSSVDGWNINAKGILSLSANNIGQSGERLNVRSDNLSSISAEGQVYLAASGIGSGQVKLAAVSATSGLFDVKMLADDLLLTGLVEADTVRINVDNGSLTLESSIRVVAYHDMALIAHGDVSLSSIQTGDGMITIDANGGSILDNTDTETANITGLTGDAVVSLRGNSVGQKVMVDGGNSGDIDLNIAKISDMQVGAGGIYLDSVRAIEVGDITTTGEFEVRVVSGDLIFSGDQSALRSILEVQEGGLSQVSGKTLMTTGVEGIGRSGNVSVTALRDISLSTISVGNGDVEMTSSLGGILDGTLADVLGNENLIINNGELVAISATGIGTHYEDGDVDMDVIDIDNANATEDGLFIGLTGREGVLATIKTVEASADGADVAVTSGNGMLKVLNAKANDALQFKIVGQADVEALLLGTTHAGGDLNLIATAGDIVQLSGADIIADTANTLTTLSAGGDITLLAVTNNFADITVKTGTNVHVVDVSGVNLFDIYSTGNFKLETVDQLALMANTSITSGADTSLSLTSENLIFGANHITTAGGSVNISVNLGDWLAINSSSILAGKDINAYVAGSIDLAETTLVEAGASVALVVDNSISLVGTTVFSAVSGDLTLTSEVVGDATIVGNTELTSGQSMVIDVADGDLNVSGTSRFTAEAGALKVLMRDGHVGFTGTSALHGDAVIINLEGVDHSAKTAGTTTITADQSNVVLELAQGDISLTGKTTILAKLDVTLASLGLGSISAGGVTNVTGTGGNVIISTQTGDISFKDKSTLISGGDSLLKINEGDLATVAATTVDAGRDIVMTLSDGYVSLSDKTVLDGDRDILITTRNGMSGSELSMMRSENIRVAIATGEVALFNSATIAAVWDLNMLVDQGYVLMDDDETLITAHDVKITVNSGLTSGEGSIHIDRIEAVETVLLQTFDGAILDNTISEDVDLIVTRVLVMEASDGIGRAWEDNLNTDAKFISGHNTLTDGINIQNRTAFSVGNDEVFENVPSAIVNEGDGDVILTSTGDITHGSETYGIGDPSEDGSLSNLFGQWIYLVHNMAPNFFEDQWGNTNRQRMASQLSGPASDKQASTAEQKRADRDEIAARDLVEMNKFIQSDDSFKRLNDRLDNLTAGADQIRSIAKSREVLNIQNRAGQKSYVASELAGNAVQFDLERANQVRSEFDQDIMLGGPLLPTNDTSPVQGFETPENINERQVQQSAIELSDDVLDIPMLAAE